MSNVVPVYPRGVLSGWLAAHPGTTEMLTISAAGIVASQTIPSAGISGSLGAVDNTIVRTDGTGGATLQGSAITITDAGVLVVKQSAGVAGVDEVQISHTGSLSLIESKDGAVRIQTANGFQLNWLDDTVTPRLVLSGGNGYLNTSNIEGSSSQAYIQKITAGVWTIGGNLGSSGGTFAHPPNTPSQITADQNDYNPSYVSRFYRLSSDASRNITGWNANTPQSGQVHTLCNVGSNNIVLVNQSASSTAARRFLTNTGADITLGANEAATMWYDSTTARWRVWKD